MAAWERRRRTLQPVETSIELPKERCLIKLCREHTAAGAAAVAAAAGAGVETAAVGAADAVACSKFYEYMT